MVPIKQKLWIFFKSNLTQNLLLQMFWQTFCYIRTLWLIFIAYLCHRGVYDSWHSRTALNGSVYHIEFKWVCANPSTYNLLYVDHITMWASRWTNREADSTLNKLLVFFPTVYRMSGLIIIVFVKPSPHSRKMNSMIEWLVIMTRWYWNCLKTK